MKTHEIVITGVDVNGRLELIIDGKNGQEIIVEKGDKVVWSIAANNVNSFRIEEKEDGSEQIFALLYRPPKRHTKKGSARVSLLNRKGAEYKYSIWWKAKESTPEREHDPKITINPALHGSIAKLLILWVISILMLVVVALMFWRKKR
jgi:hypothetical protein